MRQQQDVSEQHWSSCSLFYCERDIEKCGYDPSPTTLCGDKPPCCTHLLRDMLNITDIVFKEFGISYFLTWGSALGAMRDKAIIPWTADVDVSVMSKEVINVMFNDMNLKNRFRDFGVNLFKEDKFDMMRGCYNDFYEGGKLLCWKKNMSMDPEKKKTYLNNIPYLDVYYMAKMKESRIFHYACTYNESMILPLGEAQVLDLTLPVPGNLHEFVSWSYGPNYTVPPPKKHIHGENSDRYCQGRDLITLELKPKKQ